jgi:RNA polymerase sigma-70 factor (ECF subfamily)
MPDRRRDQFELQILPHARAAYSLARWLLRHPQDAEDAVQESVLKAFRAFDGHTGASHAAWLLAIVRNTCLTLIERRRADGKVIVLSDLASGPALDRLEREAQAARLEAGPQPDEALLAEEQRRRVHAAIAALPLQFREVLVLREFHDLTYREIADVIGTPVGTVMSRLARARERLKIALGEADTSEGSGQPL